MRKKEENETVCSNCGWNNDDNTNAVHQIRTGTVLHDSYLIGRTLGEGGFGITYLGWNILLGKKIAVKEFYPQTMVIRDFASSTKVVPLKSHEDNVARAKEAFLKEARTMAELGNIDGIVKFIDVFQENDTFYIVMDYVEGETLKAYARRRGNRIPADEAISILSPVLDAIEKVHRKGLIHRDISPDNIMMTEDGRAVLLDFGAARQISADGGHSLTVNVKHGYAPIEQYQTHGEQGPWTDIYAFCATLYRMITGTVPPSAADRVYGDEIKLPSEMGIDIDPRQENAIMKGLSPRIEDRYLNVVELRDGLFGSDAVETDEENSAGDMDTAPEEKEIPAEAEEERAEKKSVHPQENQTAEKSAPPAEPALIKKNGNSAAAKTSVKEKHTLKYVLLGLAATLAVAAAAVLTLGGKGAGDSLILEEKYSEAVGLMEECDYEGALSAFRELDGYRDSREKIEEIRSSIPYIGMAAAGDDILFGTYQNEKLEWTVLEKEGDTVVAISKNAIESRPYNKEVAQVTWETSTLRKWLNNDFYYYVFSDDEKERILDSTVTADYNPDFPTVPGNDTEDKVYILSIEEAKKYYSSDEARKYHDSGAENGESRIWWLRTPGKNTTCATYVDGSGHIYSMGDNPNRAACYPRPVIRIDVTVETRPEDPSDDVMTVPLGSSREGDYIVFGRYEQDNDLQNGSEPIKWLVLKRTEDDITAISMKALDRKAYSNTPDNKEWGSSQLRKWLNSDFIDSAFSDEEKQQISGVNGYKISIPSVNDAIGYFSSDDSRSCKPSLYVSENGGRTDINTGNCSWWLSSPGKYNDYIADVMYDGSVNYTGTSMLSSSNCVRPMIRIKCRAEHDAGGGESNPGAVPKAAMTAS